MKKATVDFIGQSPMIQSRYHDTPKLDKETFADYEGRTWRNRLHTEDGKVFIPFSAFKNCLAESAKFLSIQIPGKGKATYTKHFEAGTMVEDDIPLGIDAKKVPGHWMHVPSDGQRGGKKRVMKCFPEIREWRGRVTFLILDETITKDVFARHIEQAGKFIGIGSFRPRNNGINGRFSVKKIKWETVA